MAAQMGWAFLFAPTGAFTLEANVIFSTYALALAYAKTNPTAVVGKVISVDSGDEKGVYMIEAIGENGSLKKVGSDVDLSNYVTKDQLTSIYTYKGSVANYEALLAIENPAVGDVYNVEAAYTELIELDEKIYPAGTNWVWNGEAWDAQGGSIDLSAYATKEEVQAVSKSATDSIAEVVGDLQLANQEIAKKVTAQEGYSLISSEKLSLIDTNAADIQALEDKNLDSRLSNLEGMFKDGETSIDLSQITATISEHTTQLGTLNTNKADKSVVEDLSTTVSGYGTRLAEAEAANALQTTDISNLTTKVSGLETNHGNAITGLTTTVEGHTTTIGTLQTNVGTISGKVETIEKDYLKAADISGKLDTSVYEAKIAELTKSDSDNLAAAKKYADDLAVNYDSVGSAAQALTDAKAYADSLVYDDSALETRVKANEDALVVLNGEGDGSVKKQVADAIAGVVNSAPEDFDTLKEVADWIASDTTGAAKMLADIAKLNGADTVDGSVAKQVKDAVAAEAAIARAAEEANALSIKAISDDYLKTEHKTALELLITNEETRAKGVESGLDTRLLVIEGDYLKSSDKTALQTSIDSKVSQESYDLQIAALQKADTDNLAEAKKFTEDSLTWEDVE